MRSAAQLAELVYRDDLTNLHNRRYLYPALEQFLGSAGPASPFSLLMVDLDRFKGVNDRFGHLAGDNVLVSLAERIRESVREGEVVVRYAGDEFMVLMPETEKPGAIKIAERLRNDVAKQPFDVGNGRTTPLTLSLGVATAPADGATAPELIEAADRAMYVAKQRGRNRVCVAGDLSAGKPRVADLLRGFPCPRVVGRSTELARCESLSNLGEPGPTTLVLVEGESGTGKTRLIAEVAGRRAEAGALVLWASCRAELRTLPYAPLMDALQRRFRDDETLRREVISLLHEPERIVVGTRLEGFTPEDATLDDALTARDVRAQLFTAIAKILRYLSRARRLHLVLDDMHNADAATLKVITYLMTRQRRARGEGVQIFGTISTDAVEGMEGNSEALDSFRLEASRCPTFGVVELAMLRVEAVGELISACFPGHDFPFDFSRKIFEVSRGSPLVAEEVLILLALSGFITKTSSGWALGERGQLTVPESLADILQAHIGQLDEETGRALMKASVIGSRFSVDLLQRVLEINEGFALQLADKAVEYRLLTGGDPSNMDDISFKNRRLRELTYDVVSDDLKRETHGKVARAMETGKAVGLDEALAEIAYHLDASGDRRGASNARARSAARAVKMFRTDEAEDYFEVAGKVAAPRISAQIAEASTPLPESALPLVSPVMKGLCAVKRGVQMYPPGSRYTVQALSSCAESTRALLEHAESVTIKERAGNLEINGVQYDMSRWGAVAHQVVDDFRRAHIHSVTLNRASSVNDLETLSVGMLRFSEPDAKGDWKDFMGSRGARGVGVVPKRFRATADGAAALAGGARLEGLAQGSATHRPLLQEILRFTAAAAEAVQLYPRGSQTVRNAIDGLVSSLESAHAVLPTINLGVTQAGFLVNDLRIDARRFGPGVAVMRELFRRNDSSSVSFHQGVQSSEIEIFFRFLGAGEGALSDDSIPWAERLDGLGVRRIGVDEYVFVAADAEGGGQAPSAPEADVVRLDRATFLQTVADGSPGDLLEPRMRKALPRFLTELVLDGERAATETVVARLFANMDAPEPHLRVQALDVLRETMDISSQVVAQEVLFHASGHVTQCLREERAPAPLARLVTLGEQAAGQLLRTGDLQGASRILWQLGKAIPSDRDVDPESRRLSGTAVTRLMNSAAFQRALNTLWTPNEKRRTLALHLLESCGHQAAERLLQLIVEAQDDDARRTYALQLRAVAKPKWLEQSLARTITPFQAAHRVRNVLTVADVLVTNPFPILVRAFQHPDGLVLTAAIHALSRLGPADRQSVLIALLGIEETSMRLRTVALIGELSPPDIAPALLPILDLTDLPLELEREVCLALGKLGDVRGIPPLLQRLRSTRWSRFLRRDSAPDVRVACVWALGNYTAPGVFGTLAEATRDHDPRVRRAASAVLAAMEVPEAGADS